MSTYQSVYAKDNVQTNWFITFNGTNIKGFIHAKFFGTVSEAEAKTDELRNKIWEKWYGDAFQHSFSGPTLMADLYSEVDWKKISQDHYVETLYTELQLEDETLYTLFN